MAGSQLEMFGRDHRARDEEGKRGEREMRKGEREKGKGEKEEQRETQLQTERVGEGEGG